VIDLEGAECLKLAPDTSVSGPSVGPKLSHF